MSIPTFSLLVIIAGLILLGLGVYQLFRQRSRIMRSLQAEGSVGELLRQRIEGEYVRTRTASGTKIVMKYRYRPVIEFQTQDGQDVCFVPSIALRPAPYQVGDKVCVLYDPEKPERAQINDFIHLWFYVVMLIFFGLFSLGMGVLSYMMSSS